MEYSKGFEPGSNSRSCSVIVRVRVVLKSELTLMLTFAQVVETSVTVTNNSPFQDYPHADDHTTRSII